MIGIAAEIGAGKTTSAEYIKTLYPGTPSERFSNSLREFILWFNERKMAGDFSASDYNQREYAIEEGLCASYPWDIVSRAVSEEKLIRFVEWVTERWLSDANEIKVDRMNMQELSTALRSIFAEDILERAVIMRSSRQNSSSPITIIEGFRRLVDIGVFLADPNFFFIYLECDELIEYQRMVIRNENPGDAEMTFEEFMNRRAAEAEAQIRLLKPYAHLVINNSGDMSHLKSELRHGILLRLAGSKT